MCLSEIRDRPGCYCSLTVPGIFFQQPTKKLLCGHLIWCRTQKTKNQKKPSRHFTYMRLLGGILRPSRYQVTCGWGKLRILGAGMTAPSPWETDCERSPSSKLPMTGKKERTRGSDSLERGMVDTFSAKSCASELMAKEIKKTLLSRPWTQQLSDSELQSFSSTTCLMLFSPCKGDSCCCFKWLLKKKTKKRIFDF